MPHAPWRGEAVLQHAPEVSIAEYFTWDAGWIVYLVGSAMLQSHRVDDRGTAPCRALHRYASDR